MQPIVNRQQNVLSVKEHTYKKHKKDTDGKESQTLQLLSPRPRTGKLRNKNLKHTNVSSSTHVPVESLFAPGPPSGLATCLGILVWVMLLTLVFVLTWLVFEGLLKMSVCFLCLVNMLFLEIRLSLLLRIWSCALWCLGTSKHLLHLQWVGHQISSYLSMTLTWIIFEKRWASEKTKTICRYYNAAKHLTLSQLLVVPFYYARCYSHVEDRPFMQTVFLGKASALLPTAHSFPIHSYIHRGCIHRQSKKKDLEKEKTCVLPLNIT